MRLYRNLFVILVYLITVFLSGCSGTSLQTKNLLMSPKIDLVNYALSSNGATAESPDNSSDHQPSKVIDGDTSSLDWDNGGGWEGNLSYLRSNEPLKRSYVQINLPEKRQVKQIVVYTLDSPKYPSAKYGLRSYNLEYWHGTGWARVDTIVGKLSTVRENISEKIISDRLSTMENNVSGKIIHDIDGELITNKIRLVPLFSNDTKKDYDLTAFGGKPIFNISGSAKVIEIQVWCYPSIPKSVASEEQSNLSLIGKSQPSPDEQAIRDILNIYKQGYDNEDIKLIVSRFSDDFVTLDGKSKADIEKNATKFFEDYNSINLTFRDIRIDIAPSADSATVEANYTLECVSKADNNIRKRNDTLVFNFRKEDGQNWKIKSAK
ncbi:MAG: hypothetical protein QG641_1044 [Candidatus Poribacteria bacterium]|nr:hypothetical protein [Candidatus Poribacteria bacterium]